MKLDLDFVRAQFPEGCWEWAFFENAGGAFVPTAVIDRMSGYMRQCQVQPGYPAAISQDAAQRIDLGHRRMAQMIGAEQDEVTIVASTSLGIYVLAQALRQLWQPGDEIIVSLLNHEANSGPWRRLEEFGISIVDWPITPQGELDHDALDGLLGERTRLIAFPHVSNVTGTLNDVAAITARAHAAGALVCVDGVAYAPHRLVDVKAWDVDFYLFSYYKVFGPHQGCLYGKRDLLLAARGQYHYFFPEDDLPHKLNPAGPNHESIASLAGITDYFDAVYQHHCSDDTDADLFQRCRRVYEMFAGHEQKLAQKMVDFLAARERFRLLGPLSAAQQDRVPTFSFKVEGMPTLEVARRLAADNIAVGCGHFYARRPLDFLGLLENDEGMVRCSMAHYNTEEEVDRLLTCLDALD